MAVLHGHSDSMGQRFMTHLMRAVTRPVVMSVIKVSKNLLFPCRRVSVLINTDKKTPGLVYTGREKVLFIRLTFLQLIFKELHTNIVRVNT